MEPQTETEQTQKRTHEETTFQLDKIASIIFDIEGTTTPISFVKEKLYPYARTNVDSYLTKNFEDGEVKKAISALRDLAKKDKEEKVDGVIEIPDEDASKEDVIKAVSDNVRWQMDSARQSSELKALQGMIWKVAYESKEVKGEIFEDVGPMLKMLAAEDICLYVYSSGSIAAQITHFTHSTYGDLSGVFKKHFDTTIGKKTDKASYTKIAEEIQNSPDEILFLTDNPDEARASSEAGMQCMIVIRPGNEDLTNADLQKFTCIERFDELYGDEDDDEEDIKRFAGDNGEADDDDDEDDDEVDEDDDDGENEDDDENPEDV